MYATLRHIVIAFVIAQLAACSMFTPPSELDLRLSKPSAAARYQVTMHPPPQGAAIHQIHAWELEIRTPAGQPVPDATIGFSGGMPQHFHAFPTKPQVTDNLGAGRYVLDGVKFSMTGWWQMKLQIASPLGVDVVEFNTVIAAPGLAPTAGAQ